MADPLTDGQIAEWRRYLDQGDWHQLVTDDEFRALLDTAAEVALLRELVGYDKVTLNTILEEHHAEAGKLAEEVARLRAEVKNLTAERDLARSNYEITQRSYDELNDWVTDYSKDERLAECVKLRAERDALAARLAEAERLLRSVQFRCMSPMIGNYCPVCEMNPPTHGPDCSLAAFLARTPQEK